MPLLDSFGRTEIDGVPVLTAPSSQLFSASLVFRVGRADEDFLSGGITHLVEHLVMRGVGRTPIDVNAHVATHTTSFVASGSPHHVVDFLHRVCRQLGALDTSGLDVERKVLAAEAEGAGAGPAAEAASLRYGCRGAGLLAYRDLGVGRLTAAEIRDWAAQCFTRGNAALGVVGELPAGLSLPLPAGGRRPMSVPPLRDQPFPAWEPEASGTAVSMPVSSADGMDLAVGRLLSRAALDVVRHERGLAYNVDNDGVAVTSTTSEVAVFADNDPSRAREVVALLLDVVERFAERGPTDSELAADAEEALEALSDPRTLDDAVAGAAVDLLMGQETTTPAAMYERSRTRTPESVRAAVAASAGRALVLLPGDAELERPGFARLPWSTRPVPQGRELRPRLLKGVPRGTRLVLGEAGVAVRLPEGDLVAHFDDVVGVTVTGEGAYVLQTGDGPAVPVFPRDFRGGDDVVAALRARLPESAFVPEPDEDDDEGAA